MGRIPARIPHYTRSWDLWRQAAPKRGLASPGGNLARLLAQRLVSTAPRRRFGATERPDPEEAERVAGPGGRRLQDASTLLRYGFATRPCTARAGRLAANTTYSIHSSAVTAQSLIDRRTLWQEP